MIQPVLHNHKSTGQQMIKNANILLILGKIWTENPNYFVREQKFWYPQIRKPLRRLVCIVFWSGTTANGSERPIFGPKWPNMLVLGPICPFFRPKSNFFFYKGARVLVLIYQKNNKAPRSQCFFGSDKAPKWTRKAGIWPK